MTSNTVVPQGEQITVDAQGIYHVPGFPLIAYTPAQEAQIDSLCRMVIDAAVAKAYAGDKQIVWVDSATADTAEQHPVRLIFDEEPVQMASALFSAWMLLKVLGWDKAADLMHKGMAAAAAEKKVPPGSHLQLMQEQVSSSDYARAVVEHMDDDATSDKATEQYDELAEKFHEEFEAGAEKTAEFAQKAMEKAREQLTLAGRFTEEQGHRLKEFLENDFSRVSNEMKEGARERLNPSRLGAGALASMSKLLHKTGVVLSGFAEKADGALACKSGEITSAGKLTCNACGYEMNFKKTGRIPPCPKCHKTEFTKGY